MNFVDEVTILVKAGDGGRGCISFLREKFRPWGGPNGGNGGNGGHVILKVDAQRNTLLELAHRHHAKDPRECLPGIHSTAGCGNSTPRGCYGFQAEGSLPPALRRPGVDFALISDRLILFCIDF